MSASVYAKPQTEHYKGSCHCGRVAFEFDSPNVYDMEVNDCNCSLCRQRATRLVFVPDLKKDFRFTKGSFADLTTYQFGKKRFRHMFCPVCGCTLVGTNNDETFVAISLRAVEGVDIEKLKLKKFDGASLE